MRVAIIEDDPDSAMLLRELFARDGATPETFRRAAPFLRHASQQAFDLAVLDLRLPDCSGMTVLSRIKAMSELQGRFLPIIVVSGCADVSSIKEAFDCGASDYVTKPFHNEILLARAHAIARAPRGATATHARTLSCAGIRLERDRSLAQVQGTAVILTHREFQLAWLLMSHVGQTLSRAHIQGVIWGHSNAAASRSLDTTLSRLRTKLDLAHNPHLRVKSVYGVGYRIEDFS